VIAPKHTLKDLKAYKDSSTVVVGDFKTPFSPKDRSFRQKFNNENLDLNDSLDQMDLTDVYRIFHPATAQYTFKKKSMELSPKLIISQGRKQVLTNIRK
jgi:exonuclease III